MFAEWYTPKFWICRTIRDFQPLAEKPYNSVRKIGPLIILKNDLHNLGLKINFALRYHYNDFLI